jgi:hypothetical protein
MQPLLLLAACAQVLPISTTTTLARDRPDAKQQLKKNLTFGVETPKHK